MAIFCQHRLFGKLVVVLFLALHLFSLVTMAPMVEAASLPQGMSFSDLKAYQFPDGSLPVFCNQLDEEGGSSLHNCEGCLCNLAAILTAKSSSGITDTIQAIWILKKNDIYQAVFGNQKARSPPFFESTYSLSGIILKKVPLL